jgi:GGDEF domain-containing protein
MKRGALFLLLAFLVVLAALCAWPAYRIATAWREGVYASSLGFSSVRRAAVNTLLSEAAAAAPEWDLSARAMYEGDRRLLALVVRGAQGDVLYALPAASPYYRALDSARGLKGAELFSLSSPFILHYGGPLSAGMSIELLYAPLSQQALFAPLRDALIGFLAVLLLALLALAMLRNPLPARSSAPGAVDAENRGNGDSPDDAHMDPAAEFAIPEYVSEYDDDFEESLQASLAASALDDPALPAFDGPALPAIASDGESHSSDDTSRRPGPLTGSIATSDLPKHALGGPTGLFDPESGLCWESYLRERLDAELKRSASFEQDLSLLIASLDNSARGTEEYALFAKTTQEFFSFKDLSFQFGQSGIAVVLPNMDIDHAIRMSEELLKKLTFLLQGRSDDMSYLELFMGLSSRSGRLVEADRMVSEAMAAHRKAKDERDTRIMAFRPDPEKFRAFLASS